MSEPVYTAKTWRLSTGGWRWQTLKDGVAIKPPGPTVARALAEMSGVPSRDEAIARAQLDMEWDRDCGVEEIVLNPEAAATTAPTISEATGETIDDGGSFGRRKGFYVVMTAPPGPDSEFVELEDQNGHGVGQRSGVEWRQEGLYWTLGPFGPARSRECVVIYPREGVSVTQVKGWLEENFQKPGSMDDALPQSVVIRDGNPLVNARIEVEEP